MQQRNTFLSNLEKLLGTLREETIRKDNQFKKNLHLPKASSSKTIEKTIENKTEHFSNSFLKKKKKRDEEQEKSYFSSSNTAVKGDGKFMILKFRSMGTD